MPSRRASVGGGSSPHLNTREANQSCPVPNIFACFSIASHSSVYRACAASQGRRPRACPRRPTCARGLWQSGHAFGGALGQEKSVRAGACALNPCCSTEACRNDKASMPGRHCYRQRGISRGALWPLLLSEKECWERLERPDKASADAGRPGGARAAGCTPSRPLPASSPYTSLKRSRSRALSRAESFSRNVSPPRAPLEPAAPSAPPPAPTLLRSSFFTGELDEG